MWNIIDALLTNTLKTAQTGDVNNGAKVDNGGSWMYEKFFQREIILFQTYNQAVSKTKTLSREWSMETFASWQSSAGNVWRAHFSTLDMKRKEIGDWQLALIILVMR